MMGMLDSEQIDEILRSEHFGRIGCHAEGRTYVVPISYVFDGTSIYGHSYEGMKVRYMRENPRVCFEVDHAQDIANWQSVIAWATYEELNGRDAERVVELFLDRFLPLMTGETSATGHVADAATLQRAEAAVQCGVVFRLKILEKTGRYEHA
jgi:nitroimidazol reductase NimA-like FMN-containing flavoprotein (pyridoxamine 5'-phosphate oxidase superfamily)